MSNFGNQIKCDSCGAIWDASDREPHDCPHDIPPAPLDPERAGVNMAHLTLVKCAINNMLIRNDRSTTVPGRLDEGVARHVRSRGYTVQVIHDRGEVKTEVSI